MDREKEQLLWKIATDLSRCPWVPSSLDGQTNGMKNMEGASKPTEDEGKEKRNKSSHGIMLNIVAGFVELALFEKISRAWTSRAACSSN
jgi:hypothetical protein